MHRAKTKDDSYCPDYQNRTKGNKVHGKLDELIKSESK